MHIHLFGASGSGTTTLGRALATELDALHIDTDEVYWEKTDPPFTQARAPAARLHTLEEATRGQARWVLSGSLCGWGDVLVPRFSLAIFVQLAPALRLARLRQRERGRYGARLEPGGDMYAQHLDFMDWARRYDEGRAPLRSLHLHEAWSQRLTCPLLRVNTAAPTSALVEEVMAQLRAPGRG